MGWGFVLLASMFEVVGAIGLKMYSQQKTLFRLVLYYGGFFVSFVLLYFSFNYLNLSVAYSVWVGVGTSGAILANIFIFNEPKNRQRLLGLLIIVIGVVGLNIVA